MPPATPSETPAYAPGPIRDPEAVHRRLAHWNRRRLAPAAPRADWEATLREDQRMLRLEGAWIEHLREGVWRDCAALPRSPDGFVAWRSSPDESKPDTLYAALRRLGMGTTGNADQVS